VRAVIPHFDFVRPRSLDEALRVLGDATEPITVLAGGTDVIPGMQQNDARFCQTRTVLDIHHLPELRGVREQGEHLRIGATVTFSEIASHAKIRAGFPLLSDAAVTLGSVQIRNRATVAGNFVNNAACADSVPPLLVYEARVHIRSLKSERAVPLSDFLLAPNRTALSADELVTEIVLPRMPEGYAGRFFKLGRRRGIAISRITLAALLKLDKTRVEDLRIASGAVTPIAMRFSELEASVRGKPANEDLWATVAQDLGNVVLERTGLRWSSAYKLPVVQQALFAMLCELSSGRRA
jgi:xanthine dehydrogenase FAD-binding subunit